MITIGLFNNKGGVGKTTLSFHLGWRFSEQGYRTLIVDLDPQCNLSVLALGEERIEELQRQTIDSAIAPLFDGDGPLGEVHVEPLSGDNLGILIGHLNITTREDELSQSWPKCADGNKRAIRDVSVFAQLIRQAGERKQATLAIVDVGPNLGAINRSALLSCDYVIIPLSPDLFSLVGLKNVGPKLDKWRKDWRYRLDKVRDQFDYLPEGKMQPLGYVVNRFSVRKDKPNRAYNSWIAGLHQPYSEFVLKGSYNPSQGDDKHKLCELRNYGSLVAGSQMAHCPIWHLRSDQRGKVKVTSIKNQEQSKKDFEQLARTIATKVGLPWKEVD